jgi:integrase
MGRRRRHDRHLPRRMYLRRGAYYFVSPEGQWQPLGRDLAEAMAVYGQKIGGRWTGRTMGDVIDRYRTEVLPLKRSEHTRTDQGAQLIRLKGVFGDMLPDTVEPRDCYAYTDRRRTKGGKPATVAARHEIKLLGHVFAKAIRWGVATGNPVRSMEKEPRAKRSRYVTDAEFAAVYGRASERMQIAMDLALLTGLRRGDLLALQWSQVKAEGIEVRTSKTGAGLLFEVTADLEAVLARARRLSPQIPRRFVLRTLAGRGYTVEGFSAIWQRLMTKHVEAGGERFTFHDLRRKSASDSGSVREAQERLGHADEATTRRFYVAKPVKTRPLR